MKTKLYDYIMENRDVSKVEKLLSLKNPDTFWDDVRKFTRNVSSDHAIRRWQCLAEIRFDELIMERDGKIIEMYDGKNSIDTELNECEVLQVRGGTCAKRINIEI